LLARANWLLKLGLVNSMVKVSGSPAADVQLMVILPPLVISLGVERVRAETKGATSARRLSLLNILRS